MIDLPTQALLQAAFRRESKSFLLYIGDSFPWTASAGLPALARLQAVVAADRGAVTDLGRWMTRRKVALPFVGSYPSRFTSFNFLDLNRLLPLLVADAKKSLADLEKDAAAVTDPEARVQLTKLAELKRSALAELESLQAPAAV